jgi:hypothetical protein
MERSTPVHTSIIEIAGREYEIVVYSRPDGSHVARTAFGPNDVILNDGLTLDEVLVKHRNLLPLAINSRHLLQQARRTDA